MEIEVTAIPDVLLFKPRVFGDARGFFMETFRATWFTERDISVDFVQDNHSSSSKGVLRGLHYQIQKPQGKLVRVTRGEVYDVAVDMRRQSPTFGKSVAAILSAENRHVFWVPPGFAHGFLVLSDYAEFSYKCTEYYAPEHERSLLWNDPQLNIAWPDMGAGFPVLSEKDRAGVRFAEAEAFA